MASKGLETVGKVTIANGAALSDAFRFTGRLGIAIMPAAWTAADLGFYVCDTVDGTYVPLYDESGTLLAATVSTSRGVVLPAELAACKFVKLWSNNAGVSENQGGDRSITIMMKD